MTIVETRVRRPRITGGVDTHADVHVAAALDGVGGLLGVESFDVSAAGYAALLAWLNTFGDVALVGVEGTGSYGAGLARHLAGAAVRVVEVDRADRADRHRRGKSDPLDAVSAARSALSGRARGIPKGRDGTVEAIRALMVAKRSARNERTQTINQARGLIGTAPDVHNLGDGLALEPAAAHGLASVRSAGRPRAHSFLLARPNKSLPSLESGPSLSCPPPQHAQTSTAQPRHLATKENPKMTEISNRRRYSTPTILTPQSPQNWALTSIGVSHSPEGALYFDSRPLGRLS